jgi:hypothetical protein
MIEGRMFESTWLRMMRGELAPTARAEVTYVIRRVIMYQS